MQTAVGRPTAGQSTVVPAVEHQFLNSEAYRRLPDLREAIGFLLGRIEPDVDGEIDIARFELAVPPSGGSAGVEEPELCCNAAIRRLRRIHESRLELPTALRDVEVGVARQQCRDAVPTEQEVERGTIGIRPRPHGRPRYPLPQERFGAAGVAKLEQQNRQQRLGGASRNDRLQIAEIHHGACPARTVSR